uniref:TH1 domain-containing protein n=1 Tax=Knipowitschia caucasica TaxID=637954 RepID=A0AAV2K1M3_KNICA
MAKLEGIQHRYRSLPPPPSRNGSEWSSAGARTSPRAAPMCAGERRTSGPELKRGRRADSGESGSRHQCNVVDSALCCEWWARQLVKNIPPSDMLEVRCKAAAFSALSGERKDWGLRRAWERDYLSNIRDCPQTSSSFSHVSAQLQQRDNFSLVLFSGLCRKGNRFNKNSDRALLITDKHIYKLEPRKQFKTLKRTSLDVFQTADNEYVRRINGMTPVGSVRSNKPTSLGHQPSRHEERLQPADRR